MVVRTLSSYISEKLEAVPTQEMISDCVDSMGKVILCCRCCFIYRNFLPVLERRYIKKCEWAKLRAELLQEVTEMVQVNNMSKAVGAERRSGFWMHASANAEAEEVPADVDGPDYAPYVDEEWPELGLKASKKSPKEKRMGRPGNAFHYSLPKWDAKAATIVEEEDEEEENNDDEEWPVLGQNPSKEKKMTRPGNAFHSAKWNAKATTIEEEMEEKEKKDAPAQCISHTMVVSKRYRGDKFKWVFLASSYNCFFSDTTSSILRSDAAEFHPTGMQVPPSSSDILLPPVMAGMSHWSPMSHELPICTQDSGRMVLGPFYDRGPDH
jgi:hypothetical protein